jgi:hypothetical protein
MKYCYYETLVNLLRFGSRLTPEAIYLKQLTLSIQRNNNENSNNEKGSDDLLSVSNVGPGLGVDR